MTGTIGTSANAAEATGCAAEATGCAAMGVESLWPGSVLAVALGIADGVVVAAIVGLLVTLAAAAVCTRWMLPPAKNDGHTSPTRFIAILRD